MNWWFWRKPKCRHEWVIGEPTSEYSNSDRRFPVVCRWCNARDVLNPQEAHIHREWQRLELERTKYPAS